MFRMQRYRLMLILLVIGAAPFCCAESTGSVSLKDLHRRVENIEKMLQQLLDAIGPYTGREPLSESLRRIHNGLDAIEDSLAQPNTAASSNVVKQIVAALAETVGGRFEDVLALFNN